MTLQEESDAPEVTGMQGRSRRGLVAWIVVGLIAAAVAAGVIVLRDEGSSTHFDRTTIEDEFTTQMRVRIEKQGGTMDRLECFQDGDDLHWRCLTNATIAGQVYALTISVTCDRETVRCLSEPATVVPTG